MIGSSKNNKIALAGGENAVNIADAQRLISRLSSQGRKVVFDTNNKAELRTIRNVISAVRNRVSYLQNVGGINIQQETQIEKQINTINSAIKNGKRVSRNRLEKLVKTTRDIEY